MSSSEIPDDLRVRRTHKLLWEALMSLMNEQDFEKITVTDICERAMVHRTTFYKHYEDKYDLFLSGMRHMHNEFVMISTITWWLENDQPFPPEQMAHYMRHLFDQRISVSGNG